MEQTYNCYICGTPLEGDNASLEHILLNGIGGKLRSKKLLCKKCNGELGSSSDVALSESLSFYTDMLQVKKDRDNNHRQVMTDEDGHEVIVSKAGDKVELRRSYFEKTVTGNEKRYTITAKTEEELRKYLNGQVKAGDLTQEQMEAIMDRAVVTKHRPKLTTRTVIPEEAFPSIIRSSVNYYIENTHRYDDIKHLIPFIKGEKNCHDILSLVVFDQMPYEELEDAITHMIHVEGNPEQGVLYALMEYYGMFTYAVLLNEGYDGPELNLTYCYDVLNGREIRRDFSLPIDRKWIEDYKSGFEGTAKERFAATERRANKILAKCKENERKRVISEIVSKAFKKYPENSQLTPEIIDEVLNEVSERLAEYIIGQQEL